MIPKNGYRFSDKILLSQSAFAVPENTGEPLQDQYGAATNRRGGPPLQHQKGFLL